MDAGNDRHLVLAQRSEMGMSDNRGDYRGMLLLRVKNFRSTEPARG
jgi:hypothetical protein